MSKGKVIYHHLCKECEYLYHCFGRDVAEKNNKWRYR